MNIRTLNKFKYYVNHSHSRFLLKKVYLYNINFLYRIYEYNNNMKKYNLRLSYVYIITRYFSSG